MLRLSLFFFNDTATTEIYTLPYTTLFRSHLGGAGLDLRVGPGGSRAARTTLLQLGFGLLRARAKGRSRAEGRSEEHTSELQSLAYIVCRLLLEKKKYRLLLAYKTTCRSRQ